MGTLAAYAVIVIVELFTSEGCSSCPPADRFLQKLVDLQPVEGVQIVALGEHVDYWDRLGWKDRFSSAALTERQQVYGARFRNESVYTPQMVVDGRAEFVGTDANAAKRAIESARTASHGVMTLALHGGPESSMVRVTVTTERLPKTAVGDRADIIVVVTEDRLQTDVKRGENEGLKLSHAPVVRHLAAIGEARPDEPTTVSSQIALGADWKRENLKIVAFVQERRGRAILAAQAAPAPR